MRRYLSTLIFSLIVGIAFIFFVRLSLLEKIPGFHCEGFGCMGIAIYYFIIGIVLVPIIFGFFGFFTSKENRLKQALFSLIISLIVMASSFLVIKVWTETDAQEAIISDNKIKQEVYSEIGFSTEKVNAITSELQKLNIQIIGPANNQIKLELPAILSDANWGMKKIICEEGGYNLSAYAGKTLLFTSYPTNEVWGNSEPLNVWLVSDGNKIICVYKAVRENSITAPGIFSIEENPNIKKR